MTKLVTQYKCADCVKYKLGFRTLIGNRCFVDRKRVLFCYVTCQNSPLDAVKWMRLLLKWASESCVLLKYLNTLWLHALTERQASALVNCRSYLNIAHLFKCRANFLCENVTVGKVSGSQLTLSTRPLTSSYLRICRTPSTPDVEGVIVCSSRVHSRFVVCRAFCLMASYFLFCADLFKRLSFLHRRTSHLWPDVRGKFLTPTLTVISNSDTVYSYIHVYI